MPRPTVAEIDLSAIAHNYRALRACVKPGVELFGVVKADGYGHGAVPVSRTLAAEGVRSFAVALVEEGVELRDAGIAGRIVVLGAPFPEQAEEIISRGFEVVLSDLAFARHLDGEARRRNARVGIHLKFDTGMGRVGFLPDQAMEVLGEIVRLRHLRIAGVMTHFPVADERASCRVTQDQIGLFASVRRRLEEADVRVPAYHAANSGAILLHPEAHFEAVRPGIALYGGFPPKELPEGVTLREAMTLLTRIAQVRSLPAGATISYGRTFCTLRPSRIAVLPCGYADGFHRHNSNRSTVLVRGRRAPIVGRVCMDMFMADVSDIPDAAPGDEVVIYGRQENEEISITSAAAALGTIPHELMCGLTRRVPRVYV